MDDMEYQNVSRKRFRNSGSDEDDEDTSALRWTPTTYEGGAGKPKATRFPHHFPKPAPLKSRRDALLREVVGKVTAEGKRKRDEEREQPQKASRTDDAEVEAGKELYPDDQVLLDMCFGGRARMSGIKRSNLLITITTNKTAIALRNKTDIDKLKSDMDKLVTSIVENKANWVAKLNTQGWGVIDVDFSKPSGNAIIEGCKNKASIREMAWEEGVRFKRLHLHVMATLTYQNFNGYFHLNKRLLWEHIRYYIQGVDWGERLPYMNIRFIKNAVDTVAEYINKLHNQEEYETLAKRTLDRINEYQQGI